MSGMQLLTPDLPTSPLLAAEVQTKRRFLSLPWYERRAERREIVGGCPDHWWKPTGIRTAACTCPAY